MIGTHSRSLSTGVLIAIGLWTATCAFEPPPLGKTDAADASRTAEVKTVAELEKSLAAAVVEGDIATFDRLFADDFTHTSQNGQFRSKAEWMKGRIQGKTNYVAFDVDNLRIRIYGETAVVTGISQASWRDDDASLAKGRFRFLRVWTKRGGHWQVAAFQGTRISDGVE